MIRGPAAGKGSHNSIKRVATATIGKAYAFIHSERNITAIRQELNRFRLSPLSPLPRSAMLMAYPLGEFRKGSMLILSPKECGICIPAEAWRRRGANYFLRLLLPSTANADAAGVLGSCLAAESLRLEVFRREANPLAEVYFRDDHGIYVSLSQLGREAGVMATIVSPDAAIVQRGTK